MLCAMTGILYSLLSERRIVVDWSDFAYSDDGSNVFPRLFCVPNSDSELPPEALSSVRPSLWLDRLQKSANEVVEELDPAAHTTLRGFRRFSFDLSKLDHEETTLVMWAYVHQISEVKSNCKGRFAWVRRLSDEDVMRWLLKDFLCLQPWILNDIKHRWRQLTRSENVIGVHIRYTDNRRDITRFRGITRFTKIIDELRRRDGDLKIFLATDNKAVERSIIDRYGNVITSEKWFPQEGKVMHQSEDCPDRFQNALEALADMYMLAMCKYLVFASGSSFSYISSLLSETPQQNLFDVDRTWIDIAKRYAIRAMK